MKRSAEMQERQRFYWATRPAIERIRKHLRSLDAPALKQEDRMRIFRLIADCALNAHDVELRQMEALRFPAADPALEVPIIG